MQRTMAWSSLRCSRGQMQIAFGGKSSVRNGFIALSSTQFSVDLDIIVAFIEWPTNNTRRWTRHVLGLAWYIAPCSFPGCSIRSAERLRRRMALLYAKPREIQLGPHASVSVPVAWTYQRLLKLACFMEAQQRGLVMHRSFRPWYKLNTKTDKN